MTEADSGNPTESSLPVEVLETLGNLTSIRRFENELPSQLDRDFIDLAEFFKKAPAKARHQITQAIPVEKGLAILERGTRLAILADRSANPRLLVDALVAHAIEGARWDYRENILRLALVTHVAKKLGVDDHPIFDEAAAVAEPTVADLLREFVGRPASMKTIRSSGLEEIQTSEGVDYRQIEYVRRKRPRHPPGMGTG